VTRLEKALGLCRGRYQRALVQGEQNWSGSDLRGKASKYGGRYAASRAALLERLVDAGIAFLERVERGRLKLRFGRPVGNYVEDRCNCGRAWKKGQPTILDLMVEEVVCSKT